LILQVVRDSGGDVYAVTDEPIVAETRALAQTDGLVARPEGAATYGALNAVVRGNKITSDERVALFNTGAGRQHVEPFRPGLPIAAARGT